MVHLPSPLEPANLSPSPVDERAEPNPASSYLTPKKGPDFLALSHHHSPIAPPRRRPRRLPGTRMSTPSTATAIAPHHAHHGPFDFPRPFFRPAAHPTQSNPNESALTTTASRRAAAPAYTTTTTALPALASGGHRTPSTASKAPTASTYHTAPDTPAMTSSSRGGAQRQPDWNEYYKNGIPKEIIVIDDSPSPAPQSAASHVQQPPHADPPPTKKRRMGQANAVKQETAYSHAGTASYYDSPSGTVSTDRTTSLQQTTAPTSLGSTGSGTNNGAYPEAAAAGQKRKRVTRQTTATAKKQKDNAVNNALNSYHPPPQPPIKATAVEVRVVRDVRVARRRWPVPLLTGRQHVTHNQRVDDDDGHFIIKEDSDLTERCESRMARVRYRLCVRLTLDRLDIPAPGPRHLWQSRRGVRQAPRHQVRRQDHPVGREVPRGVAHRAARSIHSRPK